ncbi:ABC transporter permease [Paenibacillus zanthoxyli]|uniref:ABC transporter permease n=1 Tax=Paenibacillus zanthoxyli TaxID=369399 RepID=UPI000471CB32|nr:ABC transporter permease [Paenibacillus zanthoxyli]
MMIPKSTVKTASLGVTSAVFIGRSIRHNLRNTEALTMPSWLQGAAENQPISPVVEAIRGLLTGAQAPDQTWKAVLWCMLILLVSMLWSIRTFRRKAGRR